MKILVTGGAGFIGSHLVDRLIKEGHKVVIIDNLSTGKKENLNPRAKFYQLDICSPKISEVFKKEKPKVVFHLAAQIDLRKSVDDPVFDANINILGSLNLIQNFLQNSKFKIRSVAKTPSSAVALLRRRALERRRQNSKFIFSSTGGAIYGNADIIPTPENYSPRPISPYGIAKLSIEYYLYYYQKVFGLNFISLRYGNVYGPRQDPKGEAGVVAIFCDKILTGATSIINGNGRQTRDYVYVDDVVEANILALEKKAEGIFNVGTGKETSVNELFKKMIKISGKEIQAKHGPAKQGEQKRSLLDSRKIKKVLGWKSKVGLEEGLRRTMNWYSLQRVY